MTEGKQFFAFATREELIEGLQKCEAKNRKMHKLIKHVSAMQGRSWRKLDKNTLRYKWAMEMESILKELKS